VQERNLMIGRDIRFGDLIVPETARPVRGREAGLAIRHPAGSRGVHAGFTRILRQSRRAFSNYSARTRARNPRTDIRYGVS